MRDMSMRPLRTCAAATESSVTGIDPGRLNLPTVGVAAQ